MIIFQIPHDDKHCLTLRKIIAYQSFKMPFNLHKVSVTEGKTFISTLRAERDSPYRAHILITIAKIQASQITLYWMRSETSETVCLESEHVWEGAEDDFLQVPVLVKYRYLR